MSDLKNILLDAEELLKQAASASGEQANELREKALYQLKQAKEQAAEAQARAIETGRKVARATEDYAQQHPWRAAGIAAGIGILIGLLINRK